MVDIDFFNDYYGHLQGDEALTKVAALLDEVLEKYNAFAARWGEILEEVCNLNILHERSNIADVVTVSIGMCHAKISIGEHLKTCRELADQALYTAKQKGRNNFYSKNEHFDEVVC